MCVLRPQEGEPSGARQFSVIRLPHYWTAAQCGRAAMSRGCRSGSRGRTMMSRRSDGTCSNRACWATYTLAGAAAAAAASPPPVSDAPAGESAAGGITHRSGATSPSGGASPGRSASRAAPGPPSELPTPATRPPSTAGPAPLPHCELRADSVPPAVAAPQLPPSAAGRTRSPQNIRRRLRAPPAAGDWPTCRACRAPPLHSPWSAVQGGGHSGSAAAPAASGRPPCCVLCGRSCTRLSSQEAPEPACSAL